MKNELVESLNAGSTNGPKPYFCRMGKWLWRIHDDIRFSRILVICVMVFYILNTGPLQAQEKVITAGIQFKPLFSSEFFNTGSVSGAAGPASVSIKPRSGYCIGMVLRKGISNTISFESGINYVKRNFRLNVTDDTLSEDTDFSIIGYEIPVQGLVFIQLSDRIFMDVSMGFSFDFYPSDISTTGEIHDHFSARSSWASIAVLGNLGWEYRTEKSGYIYLGASYHRPFESIYTSLIVYPNAQTFNQEERLELLGNYLSIDLRYFFHSDPEKRKKKTKKPDRRQQ